jgi:hypothetical protein
MLDALANADKRVGRLVLLHVAMDDSGGLGGDNDGLHRDDAVAEFLERLAGKTAIIARNLLLGLRPFNEPGTGPEAGKRGLTGS